MNVRDRSSESFPGQVIQHGCSHLKTSDKACCETPGDITGDGGTPKNAHIPPYQDNTEVAIAGGEGENCSAQDADSGGGEAGPGTVHDGDGTQKAVIAHLDGGVNKNASVHSHPVLMSAHQRASITAADHDKIHRMPGKCGIKTGQPSADTVTMPAQSPVTATPQGQRPVTSRG